MNTRVLVVGDHDVARRAICSLPANDDIDVPPPTPDVPTGARLANGGFILDRRIKQKGSE